MKRRPLAVADYSSANLAAAFQSAEHDGFVFAASTSDAALLFVEMHVASLSADESFVNFNVTAELAEGFILHNETDSMQHEPCAFLMNFHILGNLATADSVLAVGDKPCSGEPLVKRDGGIFHHGSDLDGELALGVMAGALPECDGLD